MISYKTLECDDVSLFSDSEVAYNYFSLELF